MKKILDFLRERSYTLIFGWVDKRTVGVIDFEEEKIIINLELFVVDTYIHEYLHAVYPNLNEKKIQKKTICYIKRLTVKEIRQLCKKILKKGVER